MGFLQSRHLCCSREAAQLARLATRGPAPPSTPSHDEQAKPAARPSQRAACFSRAPPCLQVALEARHIDRPTDELGHLPDLGSQDSHTLEAVALETDNHGGSTSLGVELPCGHVN